LGMHNHGRGRLCERRRCWGAKEGIEMFWSRNTSIERKLTFVMMATSLLGLSLACLCFEIY